MATVFDELKISGSRRRSNLELFRIITMLLIISHHYVVNSGLMAKEGPVYADLFSKRSTFLLIFGAFGKTGINCFVLITGYFMCKSNITLEKYLKLYGEIVFYKIIIGVIFIITGYESFSLRWLITNILPFNKIELNFAGCFMAFYLVIPFLNILVRNMTERLHIYLLLLLLIIYTGLSTLSIGGFSVDMNYFSWFIVVYFIASYIRLYPKKIFKNGRLWGRILIINLILSVFSVLFCRWFNYEFSHLTNGALNRDYFISDSNKILAVLTSISAFLFFLNVKLKYSRVINVLGASTFGVLLIHANSDAMRQWLWKDLLDNVGAYSLGIYMPLHAIGSVVGVFVICAIIDILRMRFVEKVYLEWISKKQLRWKEYYKEVEKKIANIGQKL